MEAFGKGSTADERALKFLSFSLLLCLEKQNKMEASVQVSQLPRFLPKGLASYPDVCAMMFWGCDNRQVTELEGAGAEPAGRRDAETKVEDRRV